MTVLGIIPARRGSKGIPGKNLVSLHGKPLISYSVEAAQAASTIDRIIVSTDCDDIAAACEAMGVPVPRRRAPEHATDQAGMLGVVEEALQWCLEDGVGEIELVVLLQPTSPLRSAGDIDGTVQMLRHAGVESALTVHEMAEHPAECVKTNGANWQFLVTPPAGARGRQDYEGRYLFVNGAVYAVTPNFIRENKAFFVEGAATALYEIDRLHGVDINDPTDLQVANALLTIVCRQNQA